MTYQLQPGTIAFRAVAWLKKQPAGTEVTSSCLLYTSDAADE